MELEKKLDEIKTSLETKAADDAKKAAEAALAEVKTQLKEAEKKAEEAGKEVEELKAWKITTDESYKKDREWIDKQVMENKRKPIEGKGEAKTFNDILGETIERNADKIRNHRKGDDFRFDMLPEVKANERGEREVKAVGDMSIANNFPGATSLYADRRTDMIMNPYNRVWLADVLTQGTSTGTSIIYPKENGGEGSVEIWDDPSVNKAQLDFDLTTQTAVFKWLAGIVIVPREMLDDIPWLTSYLQSKMLISLKTRENAFVLNGWQIGSNTVTGMLQAASPYNGTETEDVKVLIDAGWGQIVEDTHDFYQPTHMVLSPRTAVAVGLHQASGSGEFDLPAGSIAFANGKLQIGGIENVSTTVIGANNFLVFDRSAAAFIRRMQPEIRMFEDSILAKVNKVMFRIEERATLAIFNNDALVKGTIAGAGSF